VKTPVILLQQVVKIFRDKRFRPVQALKGLTLEVEPGEVFGFLGPNGAGKSTTIKLLTGQIRPSGGRAQVFGLEVTNPLARARLGYLPENPAFYDFLTPREYLRLVGRIFSLSNGQLAQASNLVLEQLNLQAAADRPIRGFSKGMVQRLGLAQALLHDPELYILDEPMSGLDPVGRALVKQIILDLKKRGKTVFFSTHITSDVEMICDRFAILDKGELRALARVADIRNENSAEYLVETLAADGCERVEQCSGVGLSLRIESLLAAGYQLRSIVPSRRSLEDFFLDVIDR